MDYMESRTFSQETSSPFLLESIFISSITGIILAMVFALVVAVVFHILNFVIHFRERHPMKRGSGLQYCVTTIVHVISAILAYIMVCCIKTMNIWLFIAIILGSGIGQLVIGPFLSIHLEEKRHLKKEEENEPLCDDIPEPINNENGDKLRPRVTEYSDDYNRKHGHDNSNINTLPINLDDFIIHKPKHVDQKSSNCDQKSEYDSLNDYLSGVSECDESNM